MRYLSSLAALGALVMLCACNGQATVPVTSSLPATNTLEAAPAAAGACATKTSCCPDRGVCSITAAVPVGGMLPVELVGVDGKLRLELGTCKDAVGVNSWTYRRTSATVVLTGIQARAQCIAHAIGRSTSVPLVLHVASTITGASVLRSTAWYTQATVGGRLSYVEITTDATGGLQGIDALDVAPFTAPSVTTPLGFTPAPASERTPPANAILHMGTIYPANDPGVFGAKTDAIEILHRPDPNGGVDVMEVNVNSDGSFTIIGWWHVPAQT